MADVLLFHHVQGLTDGVQAFAERLCAGGHKVSVPDLFDGATFPTIEQGLAHVESVGFENILDAGVETAEHLPPALVYAGFSLGALIAHKLAQTRQGARGALLYHHGDVAVGMFGASWPSGVNVQFHISEEDEFYEAAVVDEFVRVVSDVASAELFVYPGSAHLFADSSLSEHEPDSAELVIERSLAFLDDQR